MAFKKGNKHGSKSSRKGVPNKATSTTREVVAAAVEANAGKIDKALSALQGKDFIDAIAKLLPYVAPKLQSTEIRDVTDDGKKSVTIRLGGKDIDFS